MADDFATPVSPGTGTPPHAGAEARGVLWMAMRYALGRATYATAECADAIEAHARELPRWQRERMAREIDQAGVLSADIDGPQWARAIRALLGAAVSTAADGEHPMLEGWDLQEARAADVLDRAFREFHGSDKAASLIDWQADALRRAGLLTSPAVSTPESANPGPRQTTGTPRAHFHEPGSPAARDVSTTPRPGTSRAASPQSAGNDDEGTPAVSTPAAEPAQPPGTPGVCWSCNNPGITYASFSGGREYYCPTCGDNFPYRDGQAPPRVQMLADGRVDELREQMAVEMARRAAETPAPTEESR